MRKDLRMLRDSLELLHPALYRYVSADSVEAAFSAAEKGLKKPMAVPQFYRILAQLMALAGDIHTAPVNMDARYTDPSPGENLFPFDVRILNDTVYVAFNNSSDTTINPGSRIVKINGVPMAAILRRMEEYFPSEGSNRTYKIRRIEQGFAVQYPFVFGPSSKYRITVSEGKEKVKTKTVAGITSITALYRTADNLHGNRQMKSLFVHAPYLSLFFQQQTAILKISTFENSLLSQAGISLTTFLDSAFRLINEGGIKSIIIDLRGNEGGESANAARLFSYISPRSFRFLDYLEATKMTYLADSARGAVYSFAGESGNYRTRDASMEEVSEQFFGISVQKPVERPFTGTVTVLANGLTSSSAAQFLSLLRRYKRGLLIGEEVPGRLQGGSGRAYARFVLPGSGLPVMISLYRVRMSYPGQPETDAPIIPDRKASYTIEDLLQGRDQGLELALEK